VVSSAECLPYLLPIIFGQIRQRFENTVGAKQKQLALNGWKVATDLANIAEIGNSALPWLTAFITIALNQIGIVEIGVGNLGIFVFTHNPTNIHSATPARMPDDAA
jgi:hypothetical protein